MTTSYGTDSIREQTEMVARGRCLLTLLQEKLMKYRANWEKENAGLIESIAALRENVAEQEDQLRGLALANYEETGNKHPSPGVDIRVLTTVEYGDMDALLWAMEHKIALFLDRVVFERIAKTNSLPFVVLRESPQATIETDLTKALEPGPGT